MQTAVSVVISGATGSSATILNTHWEKTVKLYNDHPVFHSTTEKDHWLCYRSTRWQVIETAGGRFDNDSVAVAQSEVKDLDFPQDAKGWTVFVIGGHFRPRGRLVRAHCSRQGESSLGKTQVAIPDES